MTRVITEAERDEILSLTEELIKGKEEEIRLLKAIASEARFAAPQKLKNKAINYAGISEVNFLSGKRLSLLAETGEDASTYDFEKMGTTENFPCSMTHEADMWIFYLPPTPSIKNGVAARNVGRYIGYLVKNLIKAHEEEYGKIRMMISPVVVFEYGFKEETAMTKLFDPDNRDNKRIIDAMTGTFYEDDNVLAIKTMHYGTISGADYTKVFVMEEGVFKTQMRKNSHR